MTCDLGERFGICETEQSSAEAWRDEHKKTCKVMGGAGGFGAVAGWGVLIRPGAIGDAVEVVCDCGAKKDISHVEHW